MIGEYILTVKANFARPPFLAFDSYKLANIHERSFNVS